MSSITKAVVPVAGWATRFLPAVKTYAKHLIPVVDRPQLQWVMEELIGAGIEEFCIVYREDDTTIKNFFQPNTLLEDYLAQTGKSDKLDSWHQMMDRIKHIEFLPQTKDFPYGNGVPLLVAQNFINHEPIVYLWGDDLTIEDTPGAFVTKLIENFNQYNPLAIIGTQQIPDWQIPAMGILKFIDDPNIPMRVIDMVEKPKLEDAPSNYGQGARFVISPQIIDILKTTAIDRGELWLTNAFNTAAKQGVVMALDYQQSGSQWSACGDPLTWLKANLTLALKDPKYSSGLKEYITSLNL
jgi:UTP--glucose-1-phosphate uridylyltransferase